MVTAKSLTSWIFRYFCFRSYGYAKKTSVDHNIKHPASPFVNILNQLQNNHNEVI